MSEIISIWIWILVIPIILTVLTPLINMVFSNEVVAFINNMLWSVDYFIGSKYTNLLLVMVALIIIIKIFKRMLKIIHGHW